MRRSSFSETTVRDMQHDKISFSFGQNWRDFVMTAFTPERVAIAVRHLAGFLELPDLQNKSFLDIGCGSGLSSLAAYELGAAKIVSFDIVPEAVKSTQHLRAMRGNPASWTVLQGSILDEQFLHTLEKADIVYAWGVLHHTGCLWEAMTKASQLLADNGLFYLALYTTSPKSAYWIQIKKRYNQASLFRKRLMEMGYMVRYTIIPLLIKGRNPIRFIREYHHQRGMAYLIDVRDWLGGYPYEDATIEEVLRFGRKQLHLELSNLKTGAANTEYLFVKK
jgi:SAM-dependent methyltransferase